MRVESATKPEQMKERLGSLKMAQKSLSKGIDK